MKKLIFILALLVIAAPVWSAPVIVEVNSVDVFENVEDANTSWAELYYRYDAGVGQGLVRAFALELSISGPNAFIDWIWTENGAYEVAPGGVDGIVAVFGEDNDGTWIIEQASLYNEDLEEGAKPDANGMLFGMAVAGDQGEEVCVTVALNNIRGNIVLENVTQPGLISDPCCVTLAPYEAPIECNEDLTEEQLAEWFTWEEPPVWCTPCFTTGDVTGDELLTFGDVIQVFDAVVNQAETGDPNGSSDATMDGLYTFGDVLKVFDAVQGGGGCP